MMDITKSEIVLAMLSLLMIFLITIASHWAFGIIAFAILYHTFMYARKPIIISSDKNNVMSE